MLATVHALGGDMRAVKCALVWLAFHGLAAHSAELPLASPPTVQWVSPFAGNAQPTIFRANLDEPSLDQPSHPPFDQIPPMPMPESSTGRFPADADTSITLHDATSGLTTRLPARTWRPQTWRGEVSSADYAGPSGARDAPVSKTFSNLTAVANPSLWPQSTTVKLVVRFTTTTGSTAWFSCSGSMADAGVVQTAAHCVYARDPAGLQIFAWANEIFIYPAWNGVGPDSSMPFSTQVIEHFGWARGSSFLAGTDYINNGNFDRDSGVIRIDRGSSRMVGVLTGWLGSAWGGSCAYNQSRPYSNFSYPAEFCAGGLHTGRTMYLWSGGWDTCIGNQLQINTSGGCFNAGWGGMSGSGAYFSDASGLYLHAICSNSDRSTISRYTLLWEQFTIDRNAFVAATRGTTFDFEALRLRALGSTQVATGTTMSADAEVIITNATQSDPAPGLYTLRVYLSTNNLISATDTLLASWQYAVDVGPMQTFAFTVPAPSIPPSTPSGTYWIGAILDPGTDVYPNNNDTSTWDAQPITVLADALFSSSFEF